MGKCYVGENSNCEITLNIISLTKMPLLMSLWKVDDDATRLLMIQFYKSFLKGKSKMESLKNAQSVVRQTHGFENPTYWAGFILLDGLN